ncbi:hypothetical protein CBR_g18625 [Chara braunii]|uniref:Uncharacterized protein n=1 Tax=Chara braunii TaxID=69332 RepID=A0A388JTB5_CHABU|nr:hypothetical protein CBR_g18625 [Chara braunii]|eukprot:GBG61030.1 hypothetical protein CBR_g18625 [Chara braunii]
MGRTQTKQRQLRMPYAREDPRMLEPIEKEGGLEVSLPRRVRAGEYLSSWWGMLMGMDIFVWIESGFDDRRECAIVRVTLYASPSFWIEYGIELALGHGSLLAKPLRVAEAATTKWAREVSRDGKERVLTRAAVSIMAGESGFAKILFWRNSCLLKALLHEVLQASMPPDLHALLFQGRNLSSFLRDFQDFSLTKIWDEKTMWYMLPVFVCEGLSEEVYTLMLKSQTWDKLEASLKLRFPEDGVKCRLGKGPEQLAETASTEGELSGIQRQVGMLEERLARLEEARRGERKTFEGASNGPAGQDEAEVREDHRELLLHKETPRGQVCALERDEKEGVIEIKEERESSMTLPVIAPEPKGEPIGREAPSAAGREKQRSSNLQRGNMRERRPSAGAIPATTDRRYRLGGQPVTSETDRRGNGQPYAAADEGIGQQRAQQVTEVGPLAGEGEAERNALCNSGQAGGRKGWTRAQARAEYIQQKGDREYDRRADGCGGAVGLIQGETGDG